MAKRKGGIGSWLAPVAVVVALGGLAQVEPKISITPVEQPQIETRDRFFSAASPVEHVYWAVGKASKIVRSEDGGATWVVQKTPILNNWMDIATWNADRALVVGNDGEGLITDDGGTTWQQVALPVSDIAKKVFRATIDPTGRVWAVAEFGTIVYSDDHGKSWQRVMSGEDLAWNAIAFNGAGRACVVGEFGTIRCSEDGGDNWQPVESPVDQSLMALAFRDADHAVAVGLNGTVVVSNDGGLTWEQRPAVTDRHLFDVAWDGKAWAFVGDKGVIGLGDAQASTWRIERVSQADYAWHTRIVPLAGSYLISGQSTGIWTEGKWQPFLHRG